MSSVQLSDHFTYGKLFRFTLPPMIMMIFTSIYGVVDGFFVSNYVGKTPFAAVNLIYPFLMLLGAFGFMFGSGGSALIAKTLGEGDKSKARKLFSLFIYVSIALALVIMTVSFFCLRPVSILLGAEGELIDYCVTYGRILLIALPFFILQFEFQTFFITAEKPGLGLFVTVFSGVTNMVLDYVFLAIFDWGLPGAAWATAGSQIVGGLISLIYFALPNKSLLRLTATGLDLKALIKACTNGASEFVTNISMSLVSMLYNFQLMRYAGENGVAAYGVLMYVSFIFVAIFLGYSVGVAPVVSFHFGAKHPKELKNLLRKSLIIIGVFSVCMLVLGEVLAKPFSRLYVGYDPELFEMTERAFLIYSFSFLFTGMGIFGSAFFTALNDGLTSAIISFLRTFLFQVVAVLLLPLLFKLDGIWFSVIVAEFLATAVTVIFLLVNKKKYGY
ncbi:MAG: MATE family efflux transporter [Lachnospiraceae bacterium]|nr:MATE family efflux transporter [Lachnospiraceae bacterium]